MKLRKSRLSVAVAAALSAAVLVPSISSGFSVDVVNDRFTANSGGDTLLFPIYTTSVGATTSFSVTNTSGSHTIAAKIRFRDQERSMDALDFIVVLSPFDKFDFSLAEGENGRPVMTWNDNTCVVGPNEGGVQEFPPTSASLSFVRNDDMLAVGHGEVLGLADLTDACVDINGAVQDDTACPASNGLIKLANAAKHDSDGMPANCGILATFFADDDLVNEANDASDGTGDFADGAVPFLDVPNILVGRYVITIPGEGLEAGSDAVAIQNSNLPNNTNGDVQWVTSQSSVGCNDSGNCKSSGHWAWDGRDWDHPHLGEMRNLDNFQDQLTADRAAGDWSNNTANNVGVDRVISFPNKYAYLDYIPETACGGVDGTVMTWCLLASTPFGDGRDGVYTNVNSRNLCLTDNPVRVYDPEERRASTDVQVSPGDLTSLDLCNELNILTITETGEVPIDSRIQTSDLRQVVEFTNLDAVRGWASQSINWATTGDSVLGLLWTVRATEEASQNNASLTGMQAFTD